MVDADHVIEIVTADRSVVHVIWLLDSDETTFWHTRQDRCITLVVDG